MPIQLITSDDLEKLRKDLLADLTKLLGKEELVTAPIFLKSQDVCKLLNISKGTLYNLRKKNEIPFKLIGGTCFYEYAAIERMVKGG